MRSKRYWYFLLPGLCGVCIFVLLPFADVVKRSFTTAVSGEWQGLENYRKVLSNQAFLLAAGNTAKFIICCIPLLLTSSLLVAAGLEKLSHHSFLKACFLFPYAVPAGAVVLVWKIIFSSPGFLNYIRYLLTGQAIFTDWMGTDRAFYILLVSYIWKNMGYTVVLWMAGLHNIPFEIKEAARVDGAGETRIFFSIVLPNLRQIAYTITVLSVLNSFRVFREAYLVAGSYPHESMYLMQHLFNNWFVNLDLDKMAAAAVLLTMVLLAGIGILQWIWRKE